MEAPAVGQDGRPGFEARIQQNAVPETLYFPVV